MIKHIDNLDESKKETSEGRVLVDFFATWCGPCRMIAPILEELDADPNFPVQIVKVDTDEAEELAVEHGVQAIPTLVLYRDGKIVNRTMGYQRKEQIIEFCKK